MLARALRRRLIVRRLRASHNAENSNSNHPLQPPPPPPPQAAHASTSAMSTQRKYIVVFKEGVTKEDVDKYAQQVEDNGGNVTNRYESVLNGFAAHLPESFFLSLQDDGLIDYIEEDGVVTTQQQ